MCDSERPPVRVSPRPAVPACRWPCWAAAAGPNGSPPRRPRPRSPPPPPGGRTRCRQRDPAGGDQNDHLQGDDELPARLCRRPAVWSRSGGRGSESCGAPGPPDLRGGRYILPGAGRSCDNTISPRSLFLCLAAGGASHAAPLGPRI